MMPRQRKNPPDDIHARAYRYAQDPANPTIEDIGISFGVSEATFSRWRKEDSGIDLAIKRGRKQKGRKFFKKLEELAEDGNLKAIEMWQRLFRPELGGAMGYATNNQFNILLQVLPPAKPLDQWIIEQDAEPILEDQRNVLDRQPLTPLFQGIPRNG